MDIKDLKNGYYAFGNKGAVWNNQVHIAKSGDGTYGTMCGTPMLSNNWARISEHPTIGCPDCLVKYHEQNR